MSGVNSNNIIAIIDDDDEAKKTTSGRKQCKSRITSVPIHFGGDSKLFHWLRRSFKDFIV